MNSIDASTRALFEQLPPWPLREPHTARLDGATVVIVPGAFYQTHKDTGADGGVIREEAEHLGARTDIIPLPNLASLRSNARQICAWLNRRTDQRAILVSLSKGSADVKAALAEDPQAFTRVVAWVNVSGALDGTPLVDWLFSGTLRSHWTRFLLWIRRHDIAAIRELAHNPGPIQLPAHMQAIHVVGFPERKHLTSAFARRCHKRLSHLGPNDGMGLLLADTLRWSGIVVPVWGADHYLCERRDLIRQVLGHLAEMEVPA
jgi:hypothetical protein